MEYVCVEGITQSVSFKPVRAIFSPICANSWPKRSFGAYLRSFPQILGIVMLIVCIFYTFCCTSFSDAESKFVLIHTIFACLLFRTAFKRHIAWD